MFDKRSLIIGIVIMLKKFTCIDITIYAEAQEEDYNNGIIILPLLGFVIGLFAFLISSLEIFYNYLFTSVLVFTYYCIITKTISLKETYKSLDFFIKSETQSEQISGVIGIVIICLFYFSLFTLVDMSALIIMPVAGFSGLIILSTVIKRNKKYITIVKNCNKYYSIYAFSVSFLLASLVNYKLVIPLALTYMILGCIANIGDKKIKQLPNSIEGFIIEMTQLLFLILTYLFKII